MRELLPCLTLSIEQTKQTNKEKGTARENNHRSATIAYAWWTSWCSLVLVVVVVWQLSCRGSYHFLKRDCRWCSAPLPVHTLELLLISPTSEGWQAESTPWCINSVADEVWTQDPRIPSHHPNHWANTRLIEWLILRGWNWGVDIEVLIMRW